MIEVVTEEMHGSTQHTIFVNPNLLTAAIPPWGSRHSRT